MMKFSLATTYLCALCIGIPTLSSAKRMGEQRKLSILPPGSHAYGKSYGEWSAEWWQWYLKFPKTDHPQDDVEGTQCGDGQSGQVWFLLGTGVNEVDGSDPQIFTIIREACSIPVGTPLFFPILSVQCSTVEAPDSGFQLTFDDQGNVEACASNWIDGPYAIAASLSLEIDGISVINPENAEDYRAQSPLYQFLFEDPEDNILDVSCGIDGEDCDNMLSVADGFYVMLTPFPPGKHTIRFTGSFNQADEPSNVYFGLDVTYELTVS